MGFLDDATQGNYSTVPSASSPTAPIPQAGGGPNVGDASQMLAQLIKQASGQAQGNLTNRPQIMLPGQLPPQHHEAGDVSGNFVNPNTMGGPARNSRVTMAASIGKLVANVENQHELKKARDIAYDMERIQVAMSNPTPENQQLVNEILSDSSKRKAIQKALNINFMGGEDKRKPFEKQAIDIFHKMGQPGQNGQVQQQPQQQPQQQQQGQNYFNQLQRMMPQALQLSPEAMMQAELVKLGITPSSNEQIKSITKIIGDESRYNYEMAKIQQKIDESNDKNATEAQKEVGRNNRKTADILEKLHDAKIKADAQIGAAKIRADAENQRTKILQDSNSQLRIIQSTNDQINGTKNLIKTLQDDVANKVGDTKSKTELIKQLQETNQKLADSLKSISGVSTSGGINTGADTKSSAKSQYYTDVHEAIYGKDHSDNNEDEDHDEEP